MVDSRELDMLVLDLVSSILKNRVENSGHQHSCNCGSGHHCSHHKPNKNYSKHENKEIASYNAKVTKVVPGFEVINAKFSDKTTTVSWLDGSETTVNCSGDDKYSKEIGVAFCILKKLLGGSGRFNSVIDAIIRKADKAKKQQEADTALQKRVAEKRAKKKAERLAKLKKKYPDAQANLNYKLDKIIKGLKSHGINI